MPLPKKPEELICACCGSYTFGRQWYNQDKGYGLCPSCYTWLSTKESSDEIQFSYGVRGVHFDITFKETIA